MVITKARLFWSVRARHTSPADAVFTGPTKCLSVTPIVIERDECKHEGMSWGKTVQLEAGSEAPFLPS